MMSWISSRLQGSPLNARLRREISVVLPVPLVLGGFSFIEPWLVSPAAGRRIVSVSSVRIGDAQPGEDLALQLVVSVR